MVLGSRLLAQELPTVRGYTLGASFSDVGGNRMPCERDPSGLYAQYLWCEVSTATVKDRFEFDGVFEGQVRLAFRKDTLMSITASLRIRALGVRQRWAKEADSLIALYGEPDSVRRQVHDGRELIQAYWTPLTRAQPWFMIYQVLDVGITAHLRDGRTPSASGFIAVHGCFWSDQTNCTLRD